VIPFYIGTKNCIHGKCCIMPKLQQLSNLQWCLYANCERYILCFVFLLKEEDIFMMFQSSHMHTHVVIRMTLPTSFPHFILIVLNGPLNQKMIYINFLYIPYFLMFLIYLPSGLTIV